MQGDSPSDGFIIGKVNHNLPVACNCDSPRADSMGEMIDKEEKKRWGRGLG